MRFLAVISVLTILACSRMQPVADYHTPDQGVEVGQVAPDIALPNANGDTIHLSDLRGQLVLIDFWASWCGPCRKENPHLVASYNKYKDAKFTIGKGFDVFSVSLDNNRSRWTKAIEADELSWSAHCSDLKGWKSEAAVAYGVRFIPTNWLIDKNGVIVATNLRGDQLDMKLDEYLKSF